jgi:HEPN domain-containing protein
MTTLHSYNTHIHYEKEETERITSLVLEHVSPQAIFLLGSSKSFTNTTTVFSYDTPTCCYTSHYYILALIKKEEEHALNSVQDKIENNLQHSIPTTAIVLSTAAFLAWLGKGHPFAVTILKKAEILYQSASIIFPMPSAVNEQKQKENNESLFTQAKNKTEGFLASAELHKIRQEYRLSAFMLHQAAEQSLRALLAIHTGLRINTHSIDKLLRYCSMFCDRLPHLFEKSEKGKKLYSLLNKAYIHTRYKDDYSINYEELNALTEKVKIMKQLLESFQRKTDTSTS